MTQYIDKSALVAEIERIKKSKKSKRHWHFDEFDEGYLVALDDMIKIVDTIKTQKGE